MNQSEKLLPIWQDVPRYDRDGIPIDYTYTYCFGTHGNHGEPIGRCPKCGQLVYRPIQLDQSGNWWRCTNPECSVTRLKTEEVIGEEPKD